MHLQFRHSGESLKERFGSGAKAGHGFRITTVVLAVVGGQKTHSHLDKPDILRRLWPF